MGILDGNLTITPLRGKYLRWPQSPGVLFHVIATERVVINIVSRVARTGTVTVATVSIVAALYNTSSDRQ